MQKIIATMVCWCWFITASAQPAISRVEYFIDNDPGFGNAIALSPTEISNGTFSPNINSLLSGVHILFIRSQDANGKWGVTNRQFFYRPSATGSATAPNIVKAEYFFDADPGFGNALNILLPSPASADFPIVTFNPDISTISTGIHILFIRSKDANGVWSLTNSRFFYKTVSGNSGTSPDITKVEYFVDTDPGFGSATNIAITPGANLSSNTFIVNISALPTGIHGLFIRSRDANGKWSITNRQFFYKPAPVDNNITQLTNVEYFIDNDPGFGKATPIVINPSYDLNNFVAPVNISGLSVGDHTFFIRSRSGTGHSVTNAYTFPIAALAATPFINVNSITKKEMCARDSVKISFDAQGTYNAGNIFRVELSDPSGVFAAVPPIIGTYTGTNSVIVNCQLPSHSPDGTNYRVRVSSTNPVVTGFTGSDPIIIHDRPYAQTITGDPDVNATYSYPYSVPAFAGSAWVWIAPTAVVSQTANSANLVFNTVGLSQSIKIVETNQYGCIGDTSTKNVNVYPLKITDVVPSRLTPCPDESITIAANAWGVYYTGNTFTAQLSDATGSFASPTTIGVLNPSPQPLGNSQPIIINATLPYPLANGTNYRVRIVSSNYVITSDVSAAMVVDKPNLGTDQSRSKCPIETVDLTTVFNTTNLTTSWDVASPNAVQAPGVYRLIVTNANGCKDTAFVTVINYAQPAPAFTINSNIQCFNTNNFVFINTSTISSGTIVSQQWNFGDNTTSPGISPSHIYAAAGTYNVKLIVTSNNGCKDSLTQVITVNVNPVPAYTINNIVQCLTGNSFVFTNASTISSGTIVTNQWSFGDNSTSAALSPSHSYASAGTYNVKLIVTSNNGCKDSLTQSVTVNPQPAAAFIVNNNSQCLNGNSFVFANSSTIGSGTITVFQWTFGDNSSSGVASPSHTYGSAGTYTVKLVITSNNGCKDSMSQSVTVNPQPAASFTVGNNSPCVNGNSFAFSNTSTVSSGTISFQWNFGDISTSTATNPTHTYSAAGTYTVTLLVTTNNGCTSTATTPVTVSPILVWTGASGTDWNNTGNWCQGRVPLTTEDVLIQNVPNKPALLSATTIHDVDIAASSFVDLNGQSFTINGAVAGVGTLRGSASSNLVIGGTGAAGTLNFDQTTDGSTNVLNSFTMNRTATGTATLGNKVVVLDTYTPTAGTLTTGGLLTLRSTLNKTARIATSTISNYISGNVNLERYIPSHRSWRLLAAPLTATGAPTVLNSWQEAGANVSTGTHITQAGGAATNGFDASAISVSSSIRYFDGTAFQTPTNTNVTKVTDHGAAYFLFVRGNRTIDINNASASGITTLRITGGINQGPVNAGIAGTTFSLIPNPYPSPVDYEAIQPANSLAASYYVWDANLGVVGAYRTIERTGPNTYQSTPSTGNATSDNLMRYIQSGQAFFITGNSTVNFTEAMKTNAIPSTNVFRTGSAEEMTIDLYVAESSSSYLADGVRTKFDNAYSNSVDASDILKNSNFNENLAIARSSKILAVEKRDLVDQSDTIFFKLWNTGLKNYELRIMPFSFNAPLLSAYLEDAFLGTSTPISLINPTTISFAVTADAASANPDRFRIVFRGNTTLPVNYTTVKAYQKNGGIQVDWDIATERNMSEYEVEKSGEGNQFTKAGSLTARYNNNGAASYNWFDAAPFNGNNFYRIRAIETTGNVRYSQVVNVNIGKGKSEIVVSPNPVTDKSMIVQLLNQPKGTYNVRIFNNLGQQVYASKIEHPGGSSAQTIQLNKMAQGIYQLHVTNGEIKVTLQVICN